MVESSISSSVAMFPTDFLFGAATASHQVEGDNQWNDWWDYEQSGRMPFASGRSCDHFRRYEEDFELARSWGHNSHRLSVEWSRIEPRDGEWNDDAVAHYAAVFDALRQRGLEPIVTLNHFTLPSWFLEAGGWSTNDAPARFALFVDRFVKEAGNSVTYWLTINEPTVYVQQAYLSGKWPPLRRWSWITAIKVMRNLARAHIAAYRCIKQAKGHAKVGLAHAAVDVQPCNPERMVDRASSRVRDFLLNGLFFRLIGSSPSSAPCDQHNLDFVGINYYTRSCITAGLIWPPPFFGKVCKLNHHADSGIQSSLGWEVYPAGLSNVIGRFAQYGLPILITENGIATDDDRIRCRYIEDHMRVLAQAISDGLPIIGYLHWSMMDNFEWHHGYDARFGLAEVDDESLARRARPSAELYSKICRSRRV